MDTATFDKIVERRILAITTTLASKAKEYAKEDRLHNFKVAARRLNCTPERALIGMMEKHAVSVMDIVEDIGRGISWPVAVIEEKIGDHINYLILLEALLKERATIKPKVKL